MAARKKGDAEPSLDNEEVPRYTGPNPYKDGTGEDSIEHSSWHTLRTMRHFMDAETTETEWLKTKNPVREEADPFYSWDEPGEPR